MSVSSKQIILASGDSDLRRRLEAIAASMNIDNPQAWVGMNMDKLAASPVNEDGDTVGSVYEYAYVTYHQTPPPGENPAAVTDDYLRYAIDTVKSA